MIPLAKPAFDQREEAAVAEVLRSGWVTQGPRVRAFEQQFRTVTTANFACAVSNGTTALHLALLAVGVKAGDIVLAPSYSFIATANAIRHCGAEPLFVDIEPDTFNINQETLQATIDQNCESRDGALYWSNADAIATGESPLRLVDSANRGRIACILVVHQMGMPAAMDDIIALGQRYKLPIVEDAACGIGSELLSGDRWLAIGAPHGDVACFSFHPRKVITTGEGGMLTTNNPGFDAAFRLWRHHGMGISDTTRHTSEQSLQSRYHTTGYNYRLSDIHAAIGVVQLSKLPGFLEQRRRIDQLYRSGLVGLDWLTLPHRPNDARSTWQSYAARVSPGGPLSRDQLLQRLRDDGIAAGGSVQCAHLERPYSNHDVILAESEVARRDVILLPMYSSMSDNEIQQVITALLRI